MIKETKIIAIILLIAVVGSIFVIGQRFSVEREHRTADVIVDYEEMLTLSEQSDHDISWWLEQFADMGINKVGLNEESLNSLMESDLPIQAEMMKDVLDDRYWMDTADPAILEMIRQDSCDDYDVMVTAESKEMFDFVNRAFEERYGGDRSESVATENGGYILIDGDVKDTLYHEKEKIMTTVEKKGFLEDTEMQGSVIMYLSLGLLPEKVKIIEDAGCKVEPRTASYERWNDSNVVKDVIAQYEKMGLEPTYWIMANRVIPGYDDGIDTVKEYLEEKDIPIGIVEDTTQRQNLDPDGLREVIEATGYNVVRCFSVWPYVQYRYAYYGYDSYQEIENSLFRGIVERNIKVIYYKPMKVTNDNYKYITDIQLYRDSFENLEARLAEHGITMGEAEPSRAYEAPLWVKLLAAIGAGCAALLCLKAIFNIRNRWLYILLGLGIVGVVGAYFIAPNMSELLTSFGVSVMFPCVTTTLLVYETMNLRGRFGKDESVWKLIGAGAVVLAAGVIISLLGAMMTAAPISSVNYMLELDIFRGVKVAQLLPLGYFALLFMIMGMYLWGDKTKTTLEVRDIKWILNYDIKMWMVLLGLVVGAAGIIYLARTGHETSIEASNIEILARNYLEEILYARPRTKEFIVAFPAVMLFIYSMVREWKVMSFLFGLASVIGFTSITNTFMHIRTPLELGFARTGYALLFGLILGVVYILVLEIFYRIYRKRGNRNNA